nr:hypothetical protein [Thiorhodococcus mannitoliphagus]
MRKDAIEQATLIGIEIGATMTQDPIRDLEFIQGHLGERVAQPLELALAQRLESFAIEARDMKAIRADQDSLAEHRLRGADKAVIEVRADDAHGAP